MSAAHDSLQASGVDYDPFAGDEIARVVPTTEAQREVWLADRLDAKASLAYNESVLLSLRGALDHDALAAGLQYLVDSHDALRATLGPDGETLCIGAQRAFATERIDLSTLADSEREHALALRKRAAVETPFQLETGPLFRGELIRLDDNDHLLILTAHHIVCDGWSWWRMMRELATCYARAKGLDVPAPDVAASFADYALVQAAGDQTAEHDADERYWLERFADTVPSLDLPTDRARPARRTFASARVDVMLDAALVSDIRRFGAKQGSSLFATMLGGFATLLSRLTGQPQVVVGIPAAGQSVDGLDTLVGHCVNLLPLRFDIDPAQPCRQLVKDAQGTLLDAIDHQRYTFGTLLQKLRVPRDPSRLPLVSVMFTIDQVIDDESHGFPGLQTHFATNARTHENFELFVNAVQVDGGLTLECQYNTDLFDGATIRRWMDAYAALLRGMASRPEDGIGSVSMLDEPALARLAALQPAPQPFDRNAYIHDLFERQCDRAGARVALCHGDEQLTYKQLDARANRIAHLLRARGVHQGSLVGLALDRGSDMLAGLLGILKAGAGYVPLDPGYPSDRLAYMAGDAGLAALLTQSGHADRFDLRGRPVIALDRIASELDAMPATRLARDTPATSTESVAYVIYTSGSTGRPKGVQVPHRAVVNFLASMALEPGMSADDVLVAVTTLSFDIAVLELLLPLSTGAQVVLADQQVAMDGVALASLLAASGASVMQATPATWRMLIDTGWAGKKDFRALCGGEPLPPDLAQALLSRCGELWNLYGPTETTVWSTRARVSEGQGGRAPDVHIGRPIGNTQVWVVDDSGQLCAEGTPGELWIGGDGVALGYLYRPDLTETRFVADRFSAVRAGQARGLLYRTGDRGRWRTDGNLEHQGRIDFQVKIRGFRIELGEVENVLLTHPEVTRAVAMAREDRPGDVRLVTYVVPGHGRAIDEAALKSHLRDTLPEYMIPQHVVALEAIPLLPNGKIDRSALPVPETGSANAADRVAPRNETERAVAEAMAQVLGQADVGIHDDFFAIGGHSLLAAQLTTRLNRDLGASLSLRSLFDAPTVEKLAMLVDADTASPSTQRTAIERRADQSRAPLSLVQERLRLLEAFDSGTLAYNTPSAHRLSGPLDLAKFNEAFRQLAQRQTVLRTAIAIEDGEPVQVVLDDIDPGLREVVDLSRVPVTQREDELAHRIRALVDVPFADLSQGPLFRAQMYRLAEDEHALFFMPHHIIWDGWSFDLMYADLAELYAALLEDREPVLPELPVTYGDYAAWHRDWVQGAEYAGQVKFWRERLGSANAEGGRPQPLPTDRARRRGMSGTSRSCAMTISPELSDALQARSRQLDVTVFVTLLSAWYAVLADAAGQRDMLVGTPVRGRNSSDVEGLMGYFTNLLPLRFDVDVSRPFAAFARDVRNVVLDSFGAPDIRLEDLSQALATKGSGGALLYQALFSFQDVRHRGARWGNLDHSRIEVYQPGATEDLSLFLVEHGKGMAGGLAYNADLLDEERILRLRESYLLFVEGIVANADRSVAELLADSTARVADRLAAGARVPAVTQDASRSAPGVAEAAVVPALNQADVAGDPRERYLVDMWAAILGTDVVPDDNFFDLGGNSMQAVQMADRVQKETGCHIKLMRMATQSLRDIASDLPRSMDASGEVAGVGSRLVRNVKRLFGGRAGS